MTNRGVQPAGLSFIGLLDQKNVVPGPRSNQLALFRLVIPVDVFQSEEKLMKLCQQYFISLTPDSWASGFNGATVNQRQILANFVYLHYKKQINTFFGLNDLAGQIVEFALLPATASACEALILKFVRLHRDEVKDYFQDPLTKLPVEVTTYASNSGQRPEEVFGGPIVIPEPDDDIQIVSRAVFRHYSFKSGGNQLHEVYSFFGETLFPSVLRFPDGTSTVVETMPDRAYEITYEPASNSPNSAWASPIWSHPFGASTSVAGECCYLFICS